MGAAEQRVPERELRVVFVDDDLAVLRSLERLVKYARPRWEARFMDDPEVALTGLESVPADVVFSDLNMPGMDGAAFLRQVQDRHPATVRIVLTGDPDAESVFRAVPVAHQFIAKPFDIAEFSQTLDRAEALRGTLTCPALEALVGGSNAVPSAPTTYLELGRLLAEPGCCAADVGELIEQDLGMSARVIQMASSAFFGVPKHHTRVADVVTWLGMETIRSLVLSAEVFQMFEPKRSLARFSLDHLQNHAMLTARLAQRMTAGTDAEGHAMIGGMLHDVGILVLASRAPEAFMQCLRVSDRDDLRLHEAEELVLGTTHSAVGTYLLGLWGLPQPVIDAVANHHVLPERLPLGDTLEAPTAVYFANLLTDGRSEAALRPGEDNVLPPPLSYLRLAGLEHALPRWEQLAERLRG